MFTLLFEMLSNLSSRRFPKSGLILFLVILLGGCKDEPQPLALGTLERDRIVLSAVASELILEQPVREGSRVEKGELLVRLDDHLQQTYVSQAKAEVDGRKAHLEKLRKGAREEEIAIAQAHVSDTRAGLVEAELALNRTRKLQQKNALGQADLDTVVARRATAAAALSSAEEQLRLLQNGTRQEDLNQAEAEYEAALARLSQAQIRLDEYRVTASRDGILDSLPWNVGERVFVGSPVAVILADSSPVARVYIPEPYRAGVHIGDSLTVRVDGVEDRFSGEVSWIANDPSFTPYFALNAEERARLMYLAELLLPESAQELPSGLPVQVELVR